VSRRLQRGRQSLRQRHVPNATAFRRAHVTAGSGHAQLPLGQVHIGPFQPDHLAAPQTSLAAEEDNQMRLWLSGGRLDEPLKLVGGITNGMVG